MVNRLTVVKLVLAPDAGIKAWSYICQYCGRPFMEFIDISLLHSCQLRIFLLFGGSSPASRTAVLV